MNNTYFQTLILVSLTTVTLAVTGINGVWARDSKFYFAGYLGLSHFGSQDFTGGAGGTSGTLETKAAPNFAGALGLQLNENIRFEGELSYRKLNIDNVNIAGLGEFDGDGHFKNWTGLLNLYYDFNVHSRFTPYLSGGFGISRVAGEFTDAVGHTSFNDEDYGFTWQAGAGLKYRANDRTAYSLGYRYMDSSGLEMNGVNVDHGGHEFRVGLQYNFD